MKYSLENVISWDQDHFCTIFSVVWFATKLTAPDSFDKRLATLEKLYLSGNFAHFVRVVLGLVDRADFEHALMFDEFLSILRVIFHQGFCQE